MATRGKKISEQTLATSLDGNEIIPFAKNGADGAVKASKIKEYVQPDLTAKQDKLVNSADITVGEDDKLAVTDLAKREVFVDLWTQCYDCQYDAAKGDKPFTCNGLDLSYEDAIKVYNAPRLTYNNVAGFVNLTRNVRTIILGSSSSGGALPSFVSAFRTSSLEVIRVSSDTSNAYIDTAQNAFYGCSSLKRILGTMSFTYGKGDTSNAFKGCVKLTDVSIHRLKQSIAFSDSPLLSLSSLQFLVTNAANTSAITVTVHPDAYARITDELFAQAAEKQINFATTE